MMSGRNASLPGYEQMVGLFTNPVLMEVPVSRDVLLPEWIRDVQAIQADLYAHQHASLADIRRWSGYAEHTALFESCFIYAKFPVSTGGQDGEQRVEFEPLDADTRTEHPLRVLARAFGPTLDLEFFFFENQLPMQQVEQLVAATCDLFERLGELASCRVDDVLAVICPT
jgi:non-ribosomal peptide synthetase component F